MIDLKFGLFWSGAKMSYLRYLTFKTLRHFHPSAEIELYTTDSFSKDKLSWTNEKQDFQDDSEIVDFYPYLSELGVKINKFDKFPAYAPNFQSDLFRWWWLNNNSGFYLDNDLIVLRAFNSLPLDVNLIYSAYPAVSCGFYTPVGVIGANNSDIVKWTNDLIPKFYDPGNYNSMGPFMFRSMLGFKKWNDKTFNAPSHYFYPVSESYRMKEIYDGKLILPKESLSCHWYGGLPLSQEFNKKYSPQVAQTSTDTISCILRERNLI
jgi:hypothetical protein